MASSRLARFACARFGQPPILMVGMVRTSTTSASWKKTSRTWRQRFVRGRPTLQSAPLSAAYHAAAHGCIRARKAA